MRTLTWRINGRLQSPIRRAKAQATLQRACDAWQKAGAGELHLIRDCSQIHPADIHFEFGRVIAEYGLSCRRGMQRQGGGGRHIITFADDVAWNAGGWWDRTFGGGVDLLTHALFQLGAVLGLETNEERESSAMFTARGTRKSRPDRQDVADLRRILLRSDKQSWRD